MLPSSQILGCYYWDEISASQLVNYIAQRGNPFNTEINQCIKNVATGSQLDKKNSEFLLNTASVGGNAFAEFQKSRLEENLFSNFSMLF